MTMAKYLPVAEALPEIVGEIYCEASELIGAGIGSMEVKIGNQIFCYGPVGQKVKSDIILTLIHQRGSNNDNTNTRQTTRDMISPQAMPWAQMPAPRMPLRSQQIVENTAQRKQNALNRSPRANLKIEQSQMASIADQPTTTSKSSGSLKKRLELELLALYLAAA
jgi:hypothetical protein